MKTLFEYMLYLSVVIPWMMGIVFAHGFWSTLFAAIVPPYAWYLVAEFFMRQAGIV